MTSNKSNFLWISLNPELVRYDLQHMTLSLRPTDAGIYNPRQTSRAVKCQAKGHQRGKEQLKKLMRRPNSARRDMSWCPVLDGRLIWRRPDGSESRCRRRAGAQPCGLDGEPGHDVSVRNCGRMPSLCGDDLVFGPHSDPIS